MSEGQIRIRGRETTTTAELGIRHQANGAHQTLSAQEDLQAIAQQQKTVAQATAQIQSAVKTYNENRIAQYEQEKAQIAQILTAQMSPEEQEAFKQKSDSEKEQYYKQHSTTYHQLDQQADSWGTGGANSRAVNAATTALTGILGGQSVSQVAVNTASPYAAQAIGATFSEHGSLPNGWAWLLSHGALGALNAKVNGGNAVSGAVSAAAAEAVMSAAAKELFGEKALVNGKLDVSRLTQEDKEKLSAVGALVGAASGYAVGGDTANAQVGGVVAQNAVENNYLTQKDLIDYKKEIKQKCGIQDKECMHDLIAKLKQTNEENRKKLESACAGNKNSPECLTHKELARAGLMEANKALFIQDNIGESILNIDDNIATQRVPTVIVKGKSTVTELTGFSVKEYATSENLNDIVYAESNRGNAQAIQAALNNHTVNDGLIDKVATNSLNEANPSIWDDSNLAVDTTINIGKSTVTNTIGKIKTGINDTIDNVKTLYINLTERPKETIVQWWGDTKETGKNVKDFVVDMATNPTVREEASDSVFENIDNQIQKGKYNLDLLKMGNPNEVEDIVNDTTSDAIIGGIKAAVGGAVAKAGGAVIGGITKDMPKKVNHDKKAQADSDDVKSNIATNKIARETSNFDIEHQKRTEHNAKLTTTQDGNLSVTHGLSYDAKKELDGIRAFLVENKNNPNQVSYINSKRGEPDEISIATASVITKDGTSINYLAVSGPSWSGHAPDKVIINGKEYQILRDEATITKVINGKNEDVKILPNRFNPDNNQENGNHAEKKIMSHITQQNQNGVNIDSIQLNIQNTSRSKQGACYACGGQDGTGGTIQDFKELNQDLKIHIEHGSTGIKP